MNPKLTVLVVSLCCPLTVFGAEISIDSQGSHQASIQILGPLNSGDITRFKALAYKHGVVEVSFDSPGGDLSAGLTIGQTIRELSLTTIVPPNAACFSACAIAWLGGTQRVMAPSSEVGFHAAYKIENGQKLETGMGNALVGAYFTRIGLSEKAVAYLTAAPPDKLLRLTPELAREIDIPFTLLGMQQPAEMHTTPPASKPVTVHMCEVNDPSNTPLNVRNDNREVVDTLENGTKVSIKNLKEDKGKVWALVAINSKELGWVYRNYLDCGQNHKASRKTEPRSGAYCRVTDPTNSPLNLRDSRYNVIGSMVNGTEVTVLRNGMDNSGRPWAFIRTPNGAEGWAYREYLTCFFH